MTLPQDMGLGLRAPLHEAALEYSQTVGFWEAHSENYLRPSFAQDVLLQLALSTPISLHGVAMSLAGPDPLDQQLLRDVKQLIDLVKPKAVSEHFAWCQADGRSFNDLLPAPLLETTLAHMSARVDQVQQTLGCQILIENPSTYLQFIEQEMTEPELLNRLAQQTGCGILLDLNNLVVNQINHGLVARRYLEQIDWQSVKELHVAGYQLESIQGRQVAIDSHAADVSEEVWQLLAWVSKRQGALPTLLERDGNIPQLSQLISEANYGKQFMEPRHAVA